MSLIIIIPTYNEKETVSRIIAEVGKSMPHGKVLIVDDNSPDGTANIVKDLQKTNNNIFLLERAGKEGLGKAYIHAFRHTLQTLEPSRIVMMDADMSHDPKYLIEMEKSMNKGFSVIVGSRYVPGGSTVGWNRWRKTLSYLGNLYARTIIGVPIHDLTAGFYMIDAELLRSIDLDKIDSAGYAFQMELKNLLYKNGGVFKEVPISFGDRTEGKSKISNNIIAEGIIAPWRIRLKK
jgi:dolichol-phosphate mannosyltransferase